MPASMPCSKPAANSGSKHLLLAFKAPQPRRVDLCDNVRILIEPLIDRLNMFGSMQSGSNYSLAGNRGGRSAQTQCPASFRCCGRRPRRFEHGTSIRPCQRAPKSASSATQSTSMPLEGSTPSSWSTMSRISYNRKVSRVQWSCRNRRAIHLFGERGCRCSCQRC